MFTLKRKPGERVVIPGLGLTLTVLGVRGDRARLGLAAPTTRPIHRGEAWREIAASSPRPDGARRGEVS